MFEDKTKCTGCGACAAMCVSGAITMVKDQEGFLFPQIDEALCNHCGKCGSSCQTSRPDHAEFGIAYRNQNREVVAKSASGGAFGAIVKAFWEDHPDGIIFGAAFDEHLVVRHIGVSKEQGIELLHGSKYVQSNPGNSYDRVAELLSQNVPVLFSGTPCQCDAVRKLFGNNEHLLVVDIVCNGVASPDAFRKYLDRKGLEHNCNVISYNFRNKKYYFGRGMSCTFADGSVTEKTHGQDPFCKLYMSNLISRLSCYQCRFSSPNRCSDITIGDFHGLEEMDPEFYRDGTSLVIPHSEPGKTYAEKICACGESKVYPIEKCLQPRLQAPVKMPILRRFILKDYLSTADEMFEKKYGKLL